VDAGRHGVDSLLEPGDHPFGAEVVQTLRQELNVDRVGALGYELADLSAEDLAAEQFQAYGTPPVCCAPSRADALGVALFAQGEPAWSNALRAWDMAAANPW